MNGAIHQEKQLLAGGMLFALGHSHHWEVKTLSLCKCTHTVSPFFLVKKKMYYAQVHWIYLCHHAVQYPEAAGLREFQNDFLEVPVAAWTKRQLWEVEAI
jgi:hypothetical protein